MGIGVTANPVAAWVSEQARNLRFEPSEPTTPVKFLIRDRDGNFPRSFDHVFCADGIRIVKTPVRAPRANAICERVIATLQRERLDNTLIPGHRHLETVLAEYPRHYNDHRPHRSLAQHYPRSPRKPPDVVMDIDPQRPHRTDRLGGLIHDYRMVA
jgi:transposase InsO family protein